MNKTELRQALKKYGVKLTPAEFKAASEAELQAMVDQKQAEINNKLGVVNMNNKLSMDKAIEMILANNEVTKCVGKQVKISEVNIKNHVTNNSKAVVAELSKKIDALEGTIKALVTGNAQTVKYTNVVNPNQTNRQYNQAAAKLKPIGYVFNQKTGKQDAIFGECSVCGCDIKSAKVVEYSMQRFGKVVCYAHQSSAVQTNINTDKQVNANSTIVTKHCMYCGKPVHYKNQSVMDKFVARANELGLAPIGCPSCLKAAKETKENVEKHMNQQHSQLNISEDASKEINNIFESQNMTDEEYREHLESLVDGDGSDYDHVEETQQPIIPAGNVWSAVPVSDNDNNAAY